MSTASGLRRRRVRLSRRVRPSSRYLAASLILHMVVIAAAALLFAKPPEEPIPIAVSVILETGETDAGQLDAPQAQEQQPAPQQTAVAPRPNPKPAAPPRKIAAPPSPPKAAPVARQVSSSSTESLPIVEQAPAAAASPAASNTANDGQAESGIATGASVGTGAGQQAASASGGGAGNAAGGGKTGRGANDYLERVRQALAKHKRYPDQARKLKQEGTVSISLHLARDGTVLGAQIAKASGFPLLDEAALQMARDASPVPRVPDDIDGDSVKIALPVTFSIGFFGRF